MWTTLLDQLLQGLIRIGHLQLYLPDGAMRAYGDRSEAPVVLRLLEEDLPRKLVLSPDLAAGEA